MERKPNRTHYNLIEPASLSSPLYLSWEVQSNALDKSFLTLLRPHVREMQGYCVHYQPGRSSWPPFLDVLSIFIGRCPDRTLYSTISENNSQGQKARPLVHGEHPVPLLTLSLGWQHISGIWLQLWTKSHKVISLPWKTNEAARKL